MHGRNVLLIFFSVLPIISHQQGNIQPKCSVSAEKSFFVSSSGENSVTCGTAARPCYSISYAVNLVGQNISSVLINISVGSYKEAESIKLDCGRWNLRQITFWGERQDEQVVEVDLSLDVQFCEVSLVDLHWKNSRPVLHHALLSNITICQCTAQRTNVSIIGSSSNVILQDSSISSSSGYQLGLPLLSVTSLPGYHNTLQISNCNFYDNFGAVVFVGSVHEASIIASHLEGNRAFTDGKIITVQVSHLFFSNTRFVRNFGILLGVEDSYSSASLEKCHFSCNMVNSSLFLPPVMPHSIHQVSCDNCTVDTECPVHCSPGEFLSNSILCNPCPVGSHSPGTVLNKTMLQCARCPAGTFSSKTRSKACTPCEEDTFSTKTGSASCTTCKNDFFTSIAGQASCSTLTVEFIVLTIFVFILIVAPLLILLIRNSSRTGLKEKCSLGFPLVEVKQKLCEDVKPKYSVQNDGYARELAGATSA